ncbi:MAG: VWA domain-containing protein [Bryobacterales bacterium]|nr:VWA domain-containing protein [Bryobacterales bacterium]
MMRLALAAALLAIPAAAQLKLAVTVVENKTGRAVTDLKPADFKLTDDRRPRRILDAAYETTPVDAMLLVDTSLVGEVVRPAVMDLIAQIGDKEQMAIVAYDSAADLVQDFTSSKELLGNTVTGLRYGNDPRVLDALYAGIDGGFGPATLRKVAIVVTTGFEGRSGVRETEVIRMARRSGVSIYTVYATGYERGLFESLAKETGGAVFNLRDMSRADPKELGKRIFDAVRGRYLVTAEGNLGLREKWKLEIGRQGRYLVSALPLD